MLLNWWFNFHSLYGEQTPLVLFELFVTCSVNLLLQCYVGVDSCILHSNVVCSNSESVHMH